MEVILYIGLTQAVFASFLMFSKKVRHNSDILLAIWLLVIALQLYANLVGGKYEEFTYPGLIVLKLFPYTYGPFIFIYAKLLVLEKPIFRIRYIFHFVPFVLASLFFIFFMSREEIMHELRSGFLGSELSIYHTINSVLIVASINFYIIQVLYLLRIHEKKVYNHFSYDLHKTNLNWLKTIAISFSVAYTLAVVARLFNFYLKLENPIFEPYIFPVFGLTFFAYALSFFGFNQEAIFVSPSFVRLQRRRDRLELANEEQNHKTTRYEKSGLKDVEAKTYLNDLINYVENEQPYLNGSLTIEILSKETGIPKHYLTQIINEHLHKNFYNFINEYRVNKVIEMMKKDAEQSYTILALAFDAGFNSKSSFNTIFKKFTGKTPSQYRIENF
jgi:AraC-like DNA-binding protein